eukprot:gene33717-41600_t
MADSAAHHSQRLPGHHIATELTSVDVLAEPELLTSAIDSLLAWGTGLGRDVHIKLVRESGTARGEIWLRVTQLGPQAHEDRCINSVNWYVLWQLARLKGVKVRRKIEPERIRAIVRFDRVMSQHSGMAVLEASQWIDASLSNKMKMAETVAQKSYINTSVDAINQRILGRYQNGMGKTWDDPNYMKFYNDGAVNFPYLSDGMWFLTQHKRWGILKDHPDYLAVAKQINQIDLYKQAASAMNVGIPKDPMRTSKLVDGVVWDGKDPKKYADGFKLKA